MLFSCCKGRVEWLQQGPYCPQSLKCWLSCPLLCSPLAYSTAAEAFRFFVLPDFSCKKTIVTALLKRCEPQRDRGHTAVPYCLRGLVLSGHILDHRFLPHSYGDVGSLAIPLECGQALWLIFTSRFWQKWHCVTFQTDLKSSAIFEHRLFGSRRHVRSLNSPMETRFHLRERFQSSRHSCQGAGRVSEHILDALALGTLWWNFMRDPKWEEQKDHPTPLSLSPSQNWEVNHF